MQDEVIVKLNMERPNKETMERIERFALTIREVVHDAVHHEMEREDSLNQTQIVIAVQASLKTLLEAGDRYLEELAEGESCDCEGKNETRH